MLSFYLSQRLQKKRQEIKAGFTIPFWRKRTESRCLIRDILTWPLFKKSIFLISMAAEKFSCDDLFSFSLYR